MSLIAFAVWSPDEATFRQSWIDAGILKNDPGYQFEAAYQGVEITATQGWSGVIVKTPPVFDAEGAIITPAELVPGWHCNVYVTGPLVEQMTQGLPQTDADGNLLNVFERTHAVQMFGLTQQPADPVTGFPAGYRNSVGVTYADMRDIATPANVRQ